MVDTSDGPSADRPGAPEDEDHDSPGKSSFFARLFGWEDGEDDDGKPAERDAGTPSSLSDLTVNIRNLTTMRVEDVSTPRADIIAVAESAPLDEIVEAFQSSTLSRLPVYAETLDHPLGLVHLKDLALRYGFGGGTGELDLAGLIRPLLFAPPSMPIGVLLQKMQAARIHMALVIDEYGGVDGLVTIEDLLEQIVGEIGDEHDEDENPVWTREDEGVYLVQARMDLEDFEAEIGQRLLAEDLAEEVDTLGGLVFQLAGRVPERGEVVQHPDGHEFDVIDADARRIKRLRLRLARPGPASHAAEAAE